MNTQIKTIQDEIASLVREMAPLASKLDAARKELKRVEEVEDSKVLALHPDIVADFKSFDAIYIFVDHEHDDSFREIVVDDGTLHINIGKVRGCFIGDDEMKKKEFNALAGPIRAFFKNKYFTK